MRITIACIGFLTVALGPWWLPPICMILLCIRWNAIEVLFMGLLMDFVWQGAQAITVTSWHTLPLFTILGLTLLWTLYPLRKQFLY